MDLNRLTQKSQEALHDAQTKTLRFGHTEVDGEPDPPPREQAVARLQEGEREKLLRIDEVLHERVVGQDEDVQLVADAIIRARSGIKDPRRPIGSFISSAPRVSGRPSSPRLLRPPCSTPKRT